MKKYFEDFDLTDFWDNSDEFTTTENVTDEMVKKAESKLGYKLPKSYITLIKTKNGGSPKNTCFPTKKPTSWSEDHIAITAIKGLGGTWGIDSDELGTDQAIEEWGYPKIGIAICECPSAGHDMVMLDYRKNGDLNEPEVVHVEVESEEPIITFLANEFETFIRGLVSENVFK